MAVELCRVALWLETVDPGKPLGFLDHHIRTGNSLLGTTPDLIASGLPDDTFKAIEGDNKAACSELKKRNKGEREGFGPLFQQEEQAIRDRLRLAATAIEELDESDLAHRDKKEAEFKKAETASDYRHAKFLADLWCAAFVIKKHYPDIDDDAAPDASTFDSPIAPLEGQLIHTQDELFGQPAPAAAKTPKQKQPKTKNPNQGTASGITTRHLRDFVEGRPPPRRPRNRSPSDRDQIQLLPLASRLSSSLRPRRLRLHPGESAMGAGECGSSSVLRVQATRHC